MLVLKQSAEHTLSPDAFIIPAASAEITVKKSVFRADVFYTEQAQTARDIVKQQKERYRDARHVVHAFAVGETGALLGCSDDGEPAGPAGQPVTRWFGGILLGTGGLVKAYASAAKAALDGIAVEPLIKKARFELSCRYEDHRLLLHAAAALPVHFAETQFSQTVKLSGSLPLDCCDTFSRLVTETTKGASSVHFSGT